MTVELNIDRSQAELRENLRYRGLGMVSANGSSRLLMDYKALHPEVYWELMRYIFGPEGLGITHLKIELGSDVNSSSGTEPAVMRRADKVPDLSRGAGFMVAKDARTISPDLTLDMLFWSEPRWVTDSPEVYEARYQWYRANLVAAYEELGLRFDYVSLVRNERAHDQAWIKYFVKRLRQDRDFPYDGASIKVVGGEEVCTWGYGDLMMCDKELRDITDVLGSHYTSFSTENALALAHDHGKELWFSEASSPMTYAPAEERLEGSGLTGLCGVIEMVDRFIAMFPRGGMTLCELQPVIAAYYDGVTYCHKQLIRAAEPWSGAYSLDAGFYGFLHISQFCRRGMAFIPSCCFNDGEVGGDGHALVNVTRSAMTVCDPKTGDLTVVITNPLKERVVYEIRGLGGMDYQLWQSTGRELFRLRESFPGAEVLRLELEPCSIVTLSTVVPKGTEFPENRPGEVMGLPYRDGFDYPEEWLRARGGAPLYTTDQGGAFEVEGGWLVQQITPELRAEEWGYTPEPVTCFGDDRWYDVRISAVVGFDREGDGDCYVGLGIRYALASEGQHGWWIKLHRDGAWELMRTHEAVMAGRAEGFDGTKVHRMELSARGTEIAAMLDGSELCRHTEQGPYIGAGRGALYSSFHRNRFGELEVSAASDAPSIRRFDCTDEAVEFTGPWRHELMSTFKDLNRTISFGGPSAVLEVRFQGTELALTGRTEEALVKASVDGEPAREVLIGKADHRERSWLVTGLAPGEHRVSLDVVRGEFSFDGLEVR